MGAPSPELCNLWLARAFNAQDVDAAAAMYHPDASIVQVDEVHGGSRIAFRRLGHDIFFRNLGKQFTDGSFLVDVSQNEEPLRRDETVETRDRLLEQRLLRNQSQQLFRTRSSAQRPEALATSTGEN